MEMVSAAKMRRAQERVRASRPYAERLRLMIAGLSQLNDAETTARFPLLQQRPVNRMGVLLVTSDRGLAGAFNTNVIRRTIRFMREEQENRPVEMVTIGRKGRDFFARLGVGIGADLTAVGDAPTIAALRPVIDVAVQDFIAGRIDAVYLVYTRFVNTLVQTPEVLQLLPITPPEHAGAGEQVQDYIFEPDPVTVLEALLPRYIDIQVYQALLESVASEHSARMVAMRAATDNANEFISELTLSLNKARQAQITREVSEISAGAAALRG
jgi:F-type H+-transporting ATPase subunit gamma